MSCSSLPADYRGRAAWRGPRSSRVLVQHRRHFPPVVAGFDFDAQGDIERVGVLHRLADQRGQGGGLRRRGIQTAVRHGPAGPSAPSGRCSAQRLVHAQHGELDDVRAGALHRHVGGLALGGLAELEDARVDIGDVAAAAQQGLHIALLARAFQDGLQIGADAGVKVQIGFDQFGGAGLADAQFGGDPERAGPVDDGEVDGLGLPPLVAPSPAGLPGPQRCAGRSARGCPASDVKASTRPGSLVMCANRRSSICE